MIINSSVTDVTIITVTSCNFSVFEGRFAKLIKISSRLNMDPPMYRVIKDITLPGRKDGVAVQIPAHEIEVTGTYPKFNGWTFETQLDHADGMVRGIGEGNAKHLGDTRCDHCNVNRHRNVTYIIKSDEGKKFVGGSCLKHYVNTKDLGSVAHIMTMMDSIVNGDLDIVGGGSGGGTFAFSLELILSMAVVAVREHGMYRSAQYDGMPTRDFVLWLMFPDKYSHDEVAALKEKHLPGADTEVIKIRKFINSSTDASDYFHNLRTLENRGMVTGRNMGYAVSMIACYNKHVKGVQAARKAKAVAKVSKYIGEPKQRLEMAVTLRSRIAFDGYYGTQYLHIMEDGEGNQIKWFGAKQMGELDESFKIMATIKTHDEYKGIKQTTILRPKQL